MKEKEEASERMLTDKEATQLSDTEFKAMVIGSSLIAQSKQKEGNNHDQSRVK